MARREYEDHWFSEDEIIISKDDGSRARRFTNKDEADEYYEYLKSDEVQDSIAKNQAESVEQNKEIIANQKRLLEAQERNSRMQERPHTPQYTRQVLDPEYKEWLRFQKETNPEFKKWKQEQILAELKRKQEWEEEERRKRAQELEAQRKREREMAAAQEKIAPLVSKLISGEKLTWQERCEIASITNNDAAIKKLMYDSSQKVQDALLSNPNVTGKARSHVEQKKHFRSNSTSSVSYTTATEKKEGDGCTKPLIIAIVIIFIAVAAINFIASLL